jgi:zinc/manganese transport system substrate-binding protein
VTSIPRLLRPSIKKAGLLLILGALVAACGSGSSPGSGGSAGGTPAAASGRIRVVPTTTVLADLVAQVGGDRVIVESLVPKGGEVHTFDPRPSDSAKLAEADLIVMNGLGLDDWLGRMASDAGATAAIVRLGEGLPGVTYLGGEDAATTNPHLWLNVTYAQGYVARIGEALAMVDPADARAFRDGTAAYEKRLDDLDAWVRERIATIPEANRAFVMFHDALPYFAAAYGFKVVGTVVKAPGQDPSAGQIADLVDAIRAADVKAVFSESQFSPALVKAIAEEAGATVVADLYDDTIGDPPVDSYEGIIRWDVERFVEALK